MSDSLLLDGLDPFADALREATGQTEPANGLGMRCLAKISSELVDSPHGPVSQPGRMRAQAPLVPRPTGVTGFEPYVRRAPGAARVALATGAAGPLGGDRYELEITVGAGSTLSLREVSATLVLPGVHGDLSVMSVSVRVEAGGTLIWTPEPIIAADGCFHINDVDISLAEDARLYFREEILLGRHRESPGNLSSRLRVRRAGRPVVMQRFDLGPQIPVHTSPAVIGGNRGVGSVTICEPAGAPEITQKFPRYQTSVLPIDSTCVQITALADDGFEVRKNLDAALATLGEPWGTEDAASWQAVPR
jgi:urease accessory protein